MPPRSLSLLVAACVAATPAAVEAADTWSDPFPGVRRLHRVTSNQNVNVLVVDLCARGVSLRATASDERQRTPSAFGALVGAQAVINGDFFSYADYSTNGPAMGDGGGWGGSDHGYVAPAQFGRHAVALPFHGDTGGVAAWAEQVISGHPTLLEDGEVRGNDGDALCTARHPRTMLGLSPDGGTLYLAVVDGRASPSRIGMTCGELIALMQELGAADAVNLDGGGSSAMWLAGAGVLNYPSDGSQRVVANHLAVYATGEGEARSCPHPTYAASGATFDAPLELTSGEEAVVWLEAQNDGNATWDLDRTRVGTQDPQDRASAFYKPDNWVGDNRPSGADHSTYAPGTVGRFTWVMVAPEVDVTTRFDETFQLVQEGVAWFGPKVTMSIVVHPRSGPTPPDAGGDGDGDADGDENGGGAGDGDSDGDGGGCSASGDAGAGGLGAALLALALTSLTRRRPTPARARRSTAAPRSSRRP